MEETDRGDEGETDADSADDTEPDPQSEALRRQQLLVGSGVAALAGLAVSIGATQQFPALPVPVALGVGMVTTALLFGLLYASIFAGA
jgi:hypothetical protein